MQRTHDLFVTVLGSSPRVKLLAAMLRRDGKPFNISEIAEEACISRPTTYLEMRRLTKLRMVEPRGKSCGKQAYAPTAHPNMRLITEMYLLACEERRGRKRYG